MMGRALQATKETRIYGMRVSFVCWVIPARLSFARLLFYLLMTESPIP